MDGPFSQFSKGLIFHLRNSPKIIRLEYTAQNSEQSSITASHDTQQYAAESGTWNAIRVILDYFELHFQAKLA